MRCPRGCAEGVGFCGVVAVDEKSSADAYPWHMVYASVTKADDVPLYHVVPGLALLRIVVPGAGFRCESCWWKDIALSVRAITLRKLDVKVLKDRLRLLRPAAILVDGGEPLLQDFVLEIPPAFRDSIPFCGIKTTGYVAEDRIKEASRRYDFALYEYVLGVETPEKASVIVSNLRCVLDSFKVVEIHVPYDGSQRSLAVIREIAEECGSRAAVHVVPLSTVDESAFARAYKLVKELREDGLYVYLYGDTSYTLTDTKCPSCSAPLIERKSWGTAVRAIRLDELTLKCARCGHEVRGFLVPRQLTKPLALHRELVIA